MEIVIMADTHAPITPSNGTPDISATASLTDAMTPASDSTGISGILFLTCDADKKRQTGLEYVDRLFRYVILLVPIERSIREITNLHGPYIIGKNPATISDKEISDEKVERHLKSLKETKATIEESNSSDVDHALRELYFIGSHINISISEIRHLFRSIVYTSKFCKQITENMISKIGYKDYRDEAKMYYSTIVDAVASLNLNFPLWTQTEFRVWCDQALQGLSLMKEITQQRIKIEKLVVDDRKRKGEAIFHVSVYIALFIAAFVIIGSIFGNYMQMISLKSAMLPLVWVPWPVLVWSLIGSFAAMLHRLNKQPIYEFDSMFRWLLIRPAQGVALGAALYLIIIAGLFVLNGNTSIDLSQSDGKLTTSEVVILVLCFLIGFSDKFADNVLNTIVKRYTTSKDPVDEI
jgi:hypothetical protein